MVQEAFTNRAWVSDIQGALTVGVVVEYLHLWDLLTDLELQPEVEDSYVWRLDSGWQYSAKSAYEGFFVGSTHFGPWERIWKTWVPAKCRFFLWQVAHNRCWTADRLAKCGLPHPEKFPFVIRKMNQLTIYWSGVSLHGSFGSMSLHRLVSELYPHSQVIPPLFYGGKR
jgi:hypothetical protein